MKKLFGRMVAGLSVVAIGLMIAGRRQSVQVTITPKSLDDDLDDYLARQEAQIDDIVPGAEKKIIWADSSHAKTHFSIVYLHGFSATRQETAPLSDLIARELGANLYYARLSGHGRTGEAMGEATVNDWLNDAYEAFEIGRRIGEKVILIGTSTGATLATWLAAEFAPQELCAIVMLSPNFWPKASGVGLVLWPGGRQLLRMVRGDYVEWKQFSEMHGRYWTRRYPSSAIIQMMQLVDLVDRMDLSAIQTPLLVLYSPNDQVVDPIAAQEAFERFGNPGKQIVTIDEAGDPNSHVLAGDILSPGNTERIQSIIMDFIRRVKP